ncbi:unnamed protein product [Lepeophtheirus salmonis]|uniref:(salmon louse) hypothetical protein n=1 Tax=Lepeophtheirus salmonis TaxID=72036 RepID=A0A7R8CJD5_LEPSM|nr:unnamed protein product [Lepeophtheirus salmonis]CAF2840855.1 unnamed protein product [Lepeophtheirus salmonis]
MAAISNRLLSIVELESKVVTDIKVFSNGSAAQFKNKYLPANFSWFKIDYDLDNFERNYFTTSHGKGLVNGLGGAKVIVITPQEIVENHTFLEQRLMDVSMLKGTQQIHHTKANQPSSIEFSKEKSEQTQNHCFKP